MRSSIVFLIAFCLLFHSCHFGSSKKRLGDKTDSIHLQKELCSLQQRIDSILQSDTTLQQRFHCLGAALGTEKVSIYFQNIPVDSFEVFKSAFKKDVFDSPLLEFDILSMTHDIVIEIISTDEDSLEQTVNMKLNPMSRDIPLGKRMNPDSLTMNTEFAYYPLSATQVNVFIHNHSQRTYECGDEYSLAFYNESLQKWEPLPTNPITNSVLWIIPPDYPSGSQTIELYTSETPNRPGNYRIYKTFNGSEVAYAEFELLDRQGVKRLRKQIDDYWNENLANPQDTVAHNISTTWIVHDDGDTIFVGLMNNTSRYQEMFRRKVVSYSAVSHGKVVENVAFDMPSFSDTLQVTMQTEKAVYPVGTETITVQLTNENPKGLFFGEDYRIVRKEGQQWIHLHDGGAWNSIGYGLEKGHTHTFTARLRPLVNDNRPGTYRVIKEIEFSGSQQKWYMAAEFRIE